MHIYKLAFFLAIALAFARPSLATPLLSAHEVDVELEDLDISLEPATYAHTRQLSATCRRWKSRQYYSTKNLLEEIDITGKNRDKSCCWYCSKTCGARSGTMRSLKMERKCASSSTTRPDGKSTPGAVATTVER